MKQFSRLCLSRFGVLSAMIALALTCRIASANTITETYTFPSFTGYVNLQSPVAGSSFPEFDPALGTLNSITLNDTATATFSGGGAKDANVADYTITLNFSEFEMVASKTGNGQATTDISNFTETAPGELAALTGSGSVATAISVVNHNGTPASISSTFGIESLTYNFTPAVTATAPEPSTLALLSTGLLCCLGFGRRRSSALGRPAMS